MIHTSRCRARVSSQEGIVCAQTQIMPGEMGASVMQRYATASTAPGTGGSDSGTLTSRDPMQHATIAPWNMVRSLRTDFDQLRIALAGQLNELSQRQIDSDRAVLELQVALPRLNSVIDTHAVTIQDIESNLTHAHMRDVRMESMLAASSTPKETSARMPMWPNEQAPADIARNFQLAATTSTRTSTTITSESSDGCRDSTNVSSEPWLVPCDGRTAVLSESEHGQQVVEDHAGLLSAAAARAEKFDIKRLGEVLDRNESDFSHWLSLMRSQVAEAKEEERAFLAKQRCMREEGIEDAGANKALKVRITGSAMQAHIRGRRRLQ